MLLTWTFTFEGGGELGVVVTWGVEKLVPPGVGLQFLRTQTQLLSVVFHLTTHAHTHTETHTHTDTQTRAHSSVSRAPSQGCNGREAIAKNNYD